jgi:hypothetical protein
VENALKEGARRAHAEKADPHSAVIKKNSWDSQKFASLERRRGWDNSADEDEWDDPWGERMAEFKLASDSSVIINYLNGKLDLEAFLSDIPDVERYISIITAIEVPVLVSLCCIFLKCMSDCV